MTKVQIVDRPDYVCAESDSDESDRRPARRRRVEAAQADDMDDDEVCSWTVFLDS